MTKPPKDLISHWYKRLKDEGFEDIEDTNSPNGMLKSWHHFRFQAQYDPDTFSAREKYYQLATHFLHSHTFHSELERQVWFLHSEGKSVREIAKETGEVSKDGALKIIKALQRAMRDDNTSGH